jgi:hypothetical protein
VKNPFKGERRRTHKIKRRMRKRKAEPAEKKELHLTEQLRANQIPEASRFCPRFSGHLMSVERKWQLFPQSIME